MEDRPKVKIHILRCGSMTVSPFVPCGNGKVNAGNAAAMIFAPVKSRVELPVFAYLIEHPKGRILIDTGWRREISPEGVYDADAVKKVLPAHLASFYHPILPKGEAIDEQLAAMGLCAGDIDCVVLTHLDPDHVAGLSLLKGAKRIVLPEDEYFWSCRAVYKLRQPWELWMDFPMERLFYRGSPLGSNRWAIDLLGDESVMLVNLPGHTDGLCGVLVRNGEKFVLLTSDAAFSRRNWEELIVPGFGFDAQRQMNALKWIRQMSEDPGCVGIYASHDPAVVPHSIEF